MTTCFHVNAKCPPCGSETGTGICPSAREGVKLGPASGMGASTLTGSTGRAALATTSRSITAVITVQIACLTEADLTRHVRSASHVKQAKPSDRQERIARYH